MSALDGLDKTKRRTVQALVAAGYTQDAVLAALETSSWDLARATQALVTKYGSPAVLPSSVSTAGAPGSAAGGAGPPGASRAPARRHVAVGAAAAAGARALRRGHLSPSPRPPPPPLQQ